MQFKIIPHKNLMLADSIFPILQQPKKEVRE